MSYPEHEKLKAIQPYSQKLGEFLDEFLPGKGWEICEDITESTKYTEYQPVHVSVKSMLAEFFDIDSDKIEEEKLAMLEEFNELAR